MKKLLIICVLTIILFGILTIATAKIETPSDGNDISELLPLFIKPHHARQYFSLMP